MKKALLMIALVVLLIGIPGCSAAVAGSIGTPTPTESGFNFIFKYGVTARNTLDTFHGTYTKDMVMDPAITINLTLSPQEMESIFQKMVEINFFSYPDNFSVSVPEGEIKTQVAPYSTYFFWVDNGGKTKELLWHDKYTNSDAAGDKLKELINFIRNIIESREEYKNLPEPSSGYL
jgi:hypothetical protein